MDTKLRRLDAVRRALAGEPQAPTAALVRPPVVSLTSHITTDSHGAHVHARVASASGAGELVAFVEGRERKRASYCGAATDVTLDLEATGGVNKLTLIAFDAGGGASVPVSAELVVPVVRKPELWAVVVGVGAYDRLDARWQLHADRDARALAHALKAMAGPHGAYESAHVTSLIDGQATRAAVDAALAGLRRMRANDLAIVYLAGHGWRMQGGGTVLLTSHVATLSDAQTRGITWNAIRDRLEAVSGRVLVLLDACHAGAFSQDIVVPNDHLASGLARRGRSGVVVFAAAKGRQYSYEVGASRGHFELAVEQIAVAKRAHTSVAVSKPPTQNPPTTPPTTAADLETPVGLFTTAVIAAFAKPSTDVNHDGEIQLSELVDAVTEQVSTESDGNQTPTVSHRELFGDFTVGPRL